MAVGVKFPLGSLFRGSHKMMSVQHVAQRPGMGVFAKVRMRTMCHTHAHPETTSEDFVG